VGETADLYDFEGGTLRFMEDELDALPDGRDENVLMLSHNPMHRSPGAFSLVEMDSINGLTSPLRERVAAAYGGHYHVTTDEPNEAGGYHVWITDAIWDDVRTLRLVEVWGNEVEFEYRQELLDLGE
jgi:hypothetical protein